MRQETTGCGRWSTGNCARNVNLTIRTNRICTTPNQSWKTRHAKFFGNLRYKRIIRYRPDDHNQWYSTRNENLLKSKFTRPADNWVKQNESEKYLALARERKNAMVYKSDGDAECNSRAWCSHLKKLYRAWRTWKLEDEWKPPKLQNCWDWREYFEKFLKITVTFTYLDSNRKPSANAGVETNQMSKIVCWKECVVAF